MLATLVVGQLGAGAIVNAALAAIDDGCCDCPCEAGERSDDSHDADDAPAHDASHQTCAPGCDGCACCPAAVPALLPSLARQLESPPAHAAATAHRARTATGVPGRIFRPPRPSLG